VCLVILMYWLLWSGGSVDGLRVIGVGLFLFWVLFGLW